MTPSGLGTILSGIRDIGTTHQAYERQRAQDAEEKRRADLQYQLLQGQQEDRTRARTQEAEADKALQDLIPTLEIPGLDPDSPAYAYLKKNPQLVRELAVNRFAPKETAKPRDYYVGQIVRAGGDPMQAAARLAEADEKHGDLYFAAARDITQQNLMNEARSNAGDRAQGRFDERVPPAPKAAPKDYVTARSRARISAQQYAKQIATGGDKTKLKQAALDAMGLYRNTLPAAELQKIVDEEFGAASRGATARPRLTAP